MGAAIISVSIFLNNGGNSSGYDPIVNNESLFVTHVMQFSNIEVLDSLVFC